MEILRGRLVNRWVILTGATVVQMCLGTVYAWSYFQSLLVTDYRWSHTETAWAFGLVIFSIGTSAPLAGFNLARIGPRKLAVAGGILFSLSYLLGAAALNIKSIPLFYVGYSIVGGIGIGLGYVTPVATVAKWFPKKTGLATGIVTMGFGLGAFVMSKLLAPWLLAGPVPSLPRAFFWMGVIFAAVLLPAALVLRNPPVDVARAAPADTAASGAVWPCVVSAQFWFMWIAFFFNIGAGIAVISFQSSLLQGIWAREHPELEPVVIAGYGATLIAVSSLFNGVGRLAWGMASDRFGRAESFRVLLASQMVVFGVLMTVHNPWVFCALVCYVLLCFGGGFGIMPAFVLDAFGERRSAAVYGTILTAWACAGIAGPLIMASWEDNYPDRAVIYCFLTGVIFLGAGFVFSILLSNDKVTVVNEPARSTA